MTFDIHQLKDLTYDDAEPLLNDYIDGAIEQFVNSPEGQAYLDAHPEGIGWIDQFIYLAYVYEGLTLPKMTKAHMQILMENIFPRKITLFDPSEAESAIPELVAFWQFLKREYGFRSASGILKYLETLESTFPSLMCDPAKGGFAKAFVLMGHQAGFDMTTQEGIQAFQTQYNASLKSTNPDPKMAILKNIIQGNIPAQSSQPPSASKPLETKSKTTGFPKKARPKKSKKQK